MIEPAIKADDVMSYLNAHSSLEVAWNHCDRADWMLWFLEGACRMRRLEGMNPNVSKVTVHPGPTVGNLVELTRIVSFNLLSINFFAHR